jgi:carboxypeptidase C (cathepsin A)
MSQEIGSGNPQPSQHNSPARKPGRASMPHLSAKGAAGDEPYFDPVDYGNGPDDSVTDSTEAAAVTHHCIVVDGREIAYTATVGHLVTVDESTSRPNAKMFYVAFTEDGQSEESRPVTFFYNGGPGSSSVFVLLGSFAPKRIKILMPGFTPPSPYQIEDNPDSLLDKSDLVFINPVGTGYSAAVAPHTNQKFWGVDQDACSLKQFIKRFLTKNRRWSSPKYLFGESYGTARSCVLAYLLHKDGVDLNGITLQSSILDYSQAGNPVGALPSAAADAWYHKRLGVTPTPTNVVDFLAEVAQFDRTDYLMALRLFPQTDDAIVEKLSQYTGIDKVTLIAWGLDIAGHDSRGNSPFLATLLKSKGLRLGAYDGRVTGIETETGITGKIDPNSDGNDPTMTAVAGVYTTTWNTYLNEQLKYTSNSPFTDLNDQTFKHWDFKHTDPTGVEKGMDDKGNVILYTAGDLAAVMALNVDLKVLSANGLYDFVTPFYQTIIDLQRMPLLDKKVRENLSATFYSCGHRVYLDGGSRAALKADLAKMYEATTADKTATARIRSLQEQHTV